MGYLVGFPLAAALCGLLVERLPRGAVQTSVPSSSGRPGQQRDLHPHARHRRAVWRPTYVGGAWDIDKVFWIGDILKNVAMALVATAVHRAFPDLLDRGRSDRGSGTGVAAP